MKKGELTRRTIIRKSATLFNQKGYLTTTMNDIIQETAIQKGGIYRHFKDKEQLMFESFHFSVEVMQNHLMTSVLHHDKASDQLVSFIDAFMQLSEGEPLLGGCPIFNATIEMDDLEENNLLPSIHEAMEMLIGALTNIIERGIRRQELTQTINPYDTAIYIVSTLEGGLVVGRLKKESHITNIISSNLKQYISNMTI